MSKPKPKMNRNVVCAGCGKPIKKEEPFYKYMSLMGKPTTYLHKNEECWKLHYGRWREIQRGRRRRGIQKGEGGELPLRLGLI